MKKRNSYKSFSYNPSVLGADRLWNDVRDIIVGKNVKNDYDGI